MKHFSRISLILFFLLLSISSWADDEVNYFEVASNIAKPVTIKTNLGDYSFYNNFTLHGHISRIEAFDANGNRIVNTQPYKWEAGKGHWFKFDRIYTSPYSSESDSGIYSTRPNTRNSGSTAWNTFKGAMTLASYSDNSCNIQFRGGWSSYNAENISTKINLFGMYFTGVLGKDVFQKMEAQNLRWTLGTGMRVVYDEIDSDLCLGLKAGNRGNGIDGFIEAEWTSWLFESIFGFYVNVGVGTPYDKEFFFALNEFHFDVQIGILINLFSW